MEGDCALERPGRAVRPEKGFETGHFKASLGHWGVIPYVVDLGGKKGPETPVLDPVLKSLGND